MTVTAADVLEMERLAKRMLELCSKARQTERAVDRARGPKVDGLTAEEHAAVAAQIEKFRKRQEIKR